jgi:plastocyanin
MKDNDYLPQTLTVDPGTVVKWANEGRSAQRHPDQASTGWKSPTIKPGKDFEQARQPGRLRVLLLVHGAGQGHYGTVVKNADGTIRR